MAAINEKAPPSPDDYSSDEVRHVDHPHSQVVGKELKLEAAEHLEGGGNIIAPLTTFSKEEEDQVIRSLDWHIMPMLFVLYSLSVLDRSNLGNAAIAGLDKDLKLSSKEYAWLATVFYIAYILSQWTQLGWKMFKPHKWVAFTVLAWGAISTCQAATTNWAGLMVCRVGLGIVEAMYGPGVPLYLSFFYPREKIGLRTGIFLSGSALANAYGGALAYGIAQAKGAIAPWKILFLVEGLPTCAIAVVAWFYIPDSPQTAKFLNPRQKEIAVELSLRQPGDRETTGLQWKQVLGSLLDYRSYLPGIAYFGCNVCFGSLPLFVPTIINDMGAFTSIQSNGLSAPPYLLCWMMIVAISFLSDHVKLRGPFVAIFAFIAAIGYILLGTQTIVAVRYFALFLSVQIFVSVSLLLIWVANSHATDSKRGGALSILATFGQCGPVLGTNVFPKSDAPYYRKGMWVSCGACFITFACACVQMLILWRDNRARDKKYGKDRDWDHLDTGAGYGADARFRYVI